MNHRKLGVKNLDDKKLEQRLSTTSNCAKLLQQKKQERHAPTQPKSSKQANKRQTTKTVNIPIKINTLYST